MTGCTRIDAAWADLAREHLAAGHPLIARAAGHSMWPAVRNGQRIVIEPLATPLHPGDIVLTQTESGLVLHRVVSVEAQLICTRGDTSWHADRPVALDQVIGRLASHAGQPHASTALPFALARVVSLARHVRLRLRRRT